MRTIFSKVLLWCFGTLVIALGAYLLISAILSSHFERKGGPFERTVAFQSAEAQEAYRAGGPAALSAYLRKLHVYFGPEHFLTDCRGRDLVTGADRSGLLAQVGRDWNVPHQIHGQFVLVSPSEDNQYRFIAVGRPPPFNVWSFLPYYGLILVVVALLCWILAINLVSPLRSLAHTVERFGRGDFAVRTGSRSHDEIGELARAFDEMAARIETLLTAERRLLQDISHELRSPLARLSFAAALIKTTEDRTAAAARITKEINRLTALVGALLQVTRVEGDPSSRSLEQLDVDRLLRDLLEDSRVEADAHHCDLRLENHAAGNGGFRVNGDWELLRRAIENVLRNAIRHSPAGASIDIRLESSDDKILISVRDYGTGVPEEMLQKIFQPFFRVDDSRDGQTGGVGLGLAIAYRAATAHRGRMNAENAMPGLRVCLELPLDSH